MSGSKRTPITRTTLAGISPQAVAIYREMRKLKCSCGNPAGGRGPPASEPLAQLGVFRKMRTEFYFTPELHLKDGRIIRDLDDATSFAREQEARPGVDQRDEVLHKMEHAQSKEEAHAAAHSFVRWLEELEILK